MSSQARLVRGVHQKQLVKLFESLCYSQARWTIWSDFIEMSAIAISNTVDIRNRAKREERYMTIAKKYSEKDMDTFASMLSEIVAGMEENSDQDFLGDLFMCLNLSNDHAGQFFTPYHVCKCTASISSGNLKAQVEERGWISVNDPACGAGALLVAFANECREQNVNYQQSVLFVAQDIDYIVGCMCYIQLSLLGCAGYVAIADALSNPVTSFDSKGLYPRDDGNIWYTPMYFTNVWIMRWLISVSIMKKKTPVELPKAPEIETVPIADPEPIICEEVHYSEAQAGQLTFF